jgi:signal transduction histidine kinase
MNLVDNGIKYTPEGGSVQVRIDDGADEVRIAVIDTGIGISTQEQERIFHRFHRSDQTRTKKRARGRPWLEHRPVHCRRPWRAA